MKLKNTLILVLIVFALALFAGCGAGEDAKAPDAAETAAQEADTSHLKGTISEIKDFMFVVTDKDGNDFSFPFDTKPEGLDDVADGDKVIVEYSGSLSQVDPFLGEIIAVRKAY